MPFLPILLSKIKLHHVSELGVTCWVGWVCVGGVPPLVLFLPNVRLLKWEWLFFPHLTRACEYGPATKPQSGPNAVLFPSQRPRIYKSSPAKG